MDKSNEVLPPLRAEVRITKCEWDKIDPCMVSYKNRTYEMLKPGWTDIIYDHIWSQLKLPCGFHFKNAKVNRTPDEIFYRLKENVQNAIQKLIFIVPRNRLPKVYIYIFLHTTLGMLLI